MRNLKKLILIFSLLLPWIVSAQQRPQPVTMPSPTAASLGLFSQVPVSPYTGVADVSVPLGAVEEGAIKVPVTLNYHGSGVMVDQRPGWVGLNWALQAGGQITRITKDLPDELDGRIHANIAWYTNESALFPFPVFDEIFAFKSGYYYRSRLFRGENWTDPDTIKKFVVNYRLDLFDTEPDDFVFNFLGHRGKFFWDNGEWRVSSDENIKVVFEDKHFINVPDPLFVSRTKHWQAICCRLDVNVKSFGGFTLITDDGTQYVFGCTKSDISTDAIEFSVPFYTQLQDQWMASTWYLTKIISPTGHEIKFTYEPDDYVSNMYLYFLWKTDHYMHDDHAACSLYGNTVAFHDDPDQWKADWIFPMFASYQGSLIRPTYLKAIESSNVLVQFSRSLSNDLNYDKSIYLKNRRIMPERMRRSMSGPYTNFFNLCRGQDNSAEKNIDWIFLYDVVPSSDHEDLLDALRWKKLDAVEFVDKSKPDNGLVYSLKYNNIPTERLMLQEISRHRRQTNVNHTGYYKFSYYDDPSITLPGYLEEASDHWGFANGNTIKSFTLPRSSEFVNHGPPRLDLREPTVSLNLALEGTLKSITYPTGGISTFDYEQHDYTSVFDLTEESVEECGSASSPCRAGGLRIKRIINKTDENDQTPLIQEYLYKAGYGYGANPANLTSSGVLGGKSQYEWRGYRLPVNDPDVNSVTRTVVSSQSILPMSAAQGSHVGYTAVVEKRSDGSFTTYNFTNFNNGYGDLKPEEGAWTDLSPYSVSIDRSYERGRLLERTMFRPNGNPAYSEVNTLTSFGEGYARAMFLTSGRLSCQTGDYWFDSWLALPYQVRYNKLLITETKSMYYDEEGAEEYKKVVKYAYEPVSEVNDDGYLLRSITTTGSNNEERKTTYRYPTDFPYPVDDLPSDPATLALASMPGKHMLNYPVEVVQYNNSKVIGSSVNTYLRGGNPYRSYQHNSSSIGYHGPNYSYSSSTGEWRFNVNTGFDLEFSVDKFGDKGEVLQAHSKEEVNTSFIWGYQSAFPIAKIEFATYDDVVAVLTESSITDLNNQRHTDAFIRAKMQELRAHPSMKMARVTTFTYDVLAGMTSATDPNGKTQYYEYDELNRLKLIRDDEQNIVKHFEYNLRTQSR